jgi:hypothetical protein
MKRIGIIFVLLLCIAGSAFSQWQFSRLFPLANDTSQVNDIHGLAVSPDGKVWVLRNGRNNRDSILIPDYLVKKGSGQDSIYVSRKDIVRALYVYNRDGSQATFSPIFSVAISGQQDTLGGRRVRGTVANNPGQGLRYDATTSFPAGSAKSGVGLRADHQGNILAFYGGDIYRINYQTGAGMARIVAESLGTNGVADGLGGLVSPGVDAQGNIFVNRVFPGRALKIYDKNFTYLGNAVDTTDGFSRAITVSADGNDVFYAGYDKLRVLRFHSNNGVLGPYAVADTVLKGFACESFDWNPKTKLLWASAGSYNNLPNGYPGATTGYTPSTWYAYNTATKAITDSIKWQFGVALSANERPRAIAFSTGGDTAYVGVFGSNTVPGIRMYVRGAATAVEPVSNTMPREFTLEQNYPNPFNPSTEIKFSTTTAGLVSLVIYDMLGREVALLVHEQLQPGTYKYRFDASSFPSGTYIYELHVGDKQMAKKMMLLK